MIIDLSLPVFPGMPVFPGDKNTVFQQTRTIEETGYNVHFVSTGTHTGTHIDAPFHSSTNGKTVDTALVLNACVGEAVVIDISKIFKNLKKKEIMPSHLGSALNGIGTGNRVLLATGWSRNFGEDGFFEDHPLLSEELTDILVERRIAIIGLETPSVHVAKSDVIHRKLLSANIVIVENLANLTKLGNGRVFFSAAPLKLKGLEGSPVRAYAIVPDK